MKSIVPAFFFLASLLGFASLAAAPKAPIPFADLVELKDGDTFVFLGDSITHQCLYTQYVETYFYTRYPNKRIHFRNAGVNGDQANDALLRFQEDVAAFEPDYVSVLLGMNDGHYQHFDLDTFKAYEKGMGELFRKLGKFAVAIPMGPSYFDTRQVRTNAQAAPWVKTRGPMRDYYPSVLAFYSEWVAEQAQLTGLNFVDMTTPMRRLTFEQRREDPTFTLARDAVHPEPKGHVVMATALLGDAFVIEPVSQIALTLGKRGRVEKSEASGSIENLVSKKGNLSWDYTATSLPWVLPYDAQEGYALCHAGRFSQELLQVSGLKEGVYELKIDLVPIAKFSNAQLEEGVDLQGYSHAPQYKQALEVALLNKDRNDQAVRPMRDLWAVRKGKLRAEERWLEEHPDHADYAARRASYDAEMETFYAKLKELEALALEFEGRIYEANRLVSRRYALTRVD